MPIVGRGKGAPFKYLLEIADALKWNRAHDAPGPGLSERHVTPHYGLEIPGQTIIKRNGRAEANLGYGWPTDRVGALYEFGERQDPRFREAWRHDLNADREPLLGLARRGIEDL